MHEELADLTEAELTDVEAELHWRRLAGIKPVEVPAEKHGTITQGLDRLVAEVRRRRTFDKPARDAR